MFFCTSELRICSLKLLAGAFTTKFPNISCLKENLPLQDVRWLFAQGLMRGQGEVVDPLAGRGWHIDPKKREFCVPRTQMILVLIGKELVLRGLPSKTEVGHWDSRSSLSKLHVLYMRKKPMGFCHWWNLTLPQMWLPKLTWKYGFWRCRNLHALAAKHVETAGFSVGGAQQRRDAKAMIWRILGGKPLKVSSVCRHNFGSKLKLKNFPRYFCCVQRWFFYFQTIATQY